MAEHELYNLQDLIESGINEKKILRIIIPKIQRTYAQGRIEEEPVRSSILNDIFSALASEKDVELSFIYGSLVKNNEFYDFELLDGQQRITTIFLLHLYVNIIENQLVPKWMNDCFVYETRTSSTDFINKLTKLNSFGAKGSRPSKYIGNKLWYTNAYKVDSTVQSMIIMLDHIHSKYIEINRILSDQLHRLKFYVLPLDKFGLSEELYIKMNARGLSLTPLENFKADLVGYYKPDEKSATDEELKDWLEFATKLDTDWIDIFWNKTQTSDKEFNNHFFRFLYRYCTTRVYLEYKLNNDAKSFRGENDLMLTFFEQISEQQSDTLCRYKGFVYYKELLDHKIDLKFEFTKILETFKNHSEDIFACLKSQWGDDILFFGETKSYTRETAIIFASITQFITNYKEFNLVNYNKWIRIVWNVVENTNIDGIIPQINTARNLVKILEADKNTEDIYQTLSGWLNNIGLAKAIYEEVEKAALIVQDYDYETLFKRIECHSFFKGYASIVISENVTIAELEHRIKRIEPMFEKAGISCDFKDKHQLIRAMIASVNKWDGGLRLLSITENVDADTHLKGLLRRNDIRGMMHKVLDSNDDIQQQLCAYINERVFDHEYNNDVSKDCLSVAYDRLCTDINLHKWIARSNTSSKCVVIKDKDTHVKVRVPRSWYDKIYIDNELQELIPEFTSKYNLDFKQQGQKDCRVQYGYYYNDTINIGSYKRNIRLEVIFDYRDIVTFKILYATEEQNKIIRELRSNAVFNDDTKEIIICSCTHKKADAEMSEILDQLSSVWE